MSPWFFLTFSVLGVLCGSLFAQNYQCRWSVVDIGGGAMSSTSYRADASVGQTAVGQMSSSNYQSFIGFWQIDTTHVGVQEESHWSVAEPLVTRLLTPSPNPCPSGAAPVIRYSLAGESRVSIQLFDLSGRKLQTLVNTTQKPGRYAVSLTAHSSLLTAHYPGGIYFLKMSAGDYRAANKLILF